MSWARRAERDQYVGERDLLGRWTDGKDDATLAAYRAKHNRVSIDDLPALPVADGNPASGFGRNRA